MDKKHFLIYLQILYIYFNIKLVKLIIEINYSTNYKNIYYNILLTLRLNPNKVEKALLIIISNIFNQFLIKVEVNIIKKKW